MSPLLLFVSFLLEMRSYLFSRLDSSNPPASASHIAGTIGTNYHIRSMTPLLKNQFLLNPISFRNFLEVKIMLMKAANNLNLEYKFQEGHGNTNINHIYEEGQNWNLRRQNENSTNRKIKIGPDKILSYGAIL